MTGVSDAPAATGPGHVRGFLLAAAATGTRCRARPLAIGRSGLWPLAGGPARFSRIELACRRDNTVNRLAARCEDLPERDDPAMVDTGMTRWIDALTRRRQSVAGLSWEAPRLMGVINVTPDSFSDGGRFLDPMRAVDHGLRLVDQGADILDVGGESTRPGAVTVAADEESRRIVPVVRALAEQGALVSIDTRHAPVMADALAAGARMINDVSALTGDSESLRVARDSDVPVILMHMQGEPGSMQSAPRYVDAPLDVLDLLEARVSACADAGLAPSRVIVDPGIGFGKTLRHNLELMEALGLLHGLGCPVLLGASRKSFIARVDREQPVEHRLGGSIAAALSGVANGVQILRVHDVEETRQAVAVWQAIASGGPAGWR